MSLKNSQTFAVLQTQHFSGLVIHNTKTSRMVSGQVDKSIKVWDLENGKFTSGGLILALA